jgi:hypothetical protein
VAALEKNTNGGFTGAMLVIIGILLLFVWPFGTLIGVIMIIAGSQIGNGYRCGECGNKVDSKQVKICPTCKTTLSLP